MINLEVDGKPVSVPDGSMVMTATNQLGVYVPHFCWHKKLSIAANCRMCLVQVEKAPKPLPACATPVTEGMKVWTRSDTAINAQKGVMEFLLINHPLDCPICDQGGECQLQDLAVGYGGSASRYAEPKRIVVNKEIGPLVAAEEMSRCIHCTRCVRFGQEVAGVMELGMAGRGEHSEILSFVGKTVDSELSGNMIDLCPVGALTSKPFRYSARTWELSRRRSVSPHCGLGSNLVVQVKGNRVMRVLPLENESINECWLSDKDRFSYEALNTEERLVKPMIRKDGQWREVEWPAALEFVASELKRIRAASGGEHIGVLASPHSTLEELYLAAKLARGLGSGNVDFRLRHTDFALDGKRRGSPWLGMPIEQVSALKRVLVIGSNLRKDHPLLAARIRGASKKGLLLSLINATDDNQLIPTAAKAIVAPSRMPETLAQVLKAVVALKNAEVDRAVAELIANVTSSDSAKRIAEMLCGGEPAAIFLGNMAQHHPRASTLEVLANNLARVIGAKCGVLGEAANSVGGHIAGALPTANGMSASAMISNPRKAYVLLGCEPELDSANGAAALKALHQAEFVVAMSPFEHRALDYAHVVLPIAPFTETGGTFVNTEGRVQSFRGVVQPLGETRPAWKVLRVLGNLLGVEGMSYESVEDIKAEALRGSDNVATLLDNGFTSLPELSIASSGSGMERIGDIPIHFADPIARRAPALQKTHDAETPQANMHGNTLAKLGVSIGDQVRVTQEAGHATLFAGRDDGVPEGCVRVAGAHPLTAELGGLLDAAHVERIAGSARVSA